MPTNPAFWDQVVLQTLTLFVLLVGWIGVLVPVFPGLLIMWLGTLFYALMQNEAGRMNWLTWTLFGVITVLMVVGNFIDNVIITRKMRGRAIPWTSIGLAFLAGLVGSFFLTPLVGLFVAPLTLFVVEWMRLHSRRRGFDSAKAYMVAWGWSFAAVFGIGFLIILVWMLWAFAIFPAPAGV